MRKKLSSVKGKQILVTCLALLVIASGYYRWSVDKTGEALPTSGSALPSGEEKAAGGDAKKDAGKAAEVTDEETSDYFALARYERDCARSEATELLKTAATNGDEGGEKREKEIAMQAKNAQSEAVIESLVKAKGFADCAAFVDETGVRVVVKSDNLTASGVSQIKDIVMEKTGVKATQIKISSKN